MYSSRFICHNSQCASSGNAKNPVEDKEKWKIPRAKWREGFYYVRILDEDAALSPLPKPPGQLGQGFFLDAGDVATCLL